MPHTARNIFTTCLSFCMLLVMPYANAESRLSTSTINGITEQNLYSDNTTIPGTTNQIRSIQSFQHGLSFFDVLIGLNVDIDLDGHYSGFSISLDLESSFRPTEVYAVLYLSQRGGPLLEYAVTGNFTVSGSTPTDSVFIETTLESGYPNGFYDHHIEIYDAQTDSLLLSYGPEDSAHLFNLPIESQRTEFFVGTAGVSLSISSAGSVSLPFIATLLIMLLAHRNRRHSSAGT